MLIHAKWPKFALQNMTRKSHFILLFTSLVSFSASSMAASTACYLKGVADQLQCGSVSVSENYQQPNGKKIDIHYAILPATKATHPQQALLAIAGGPGQSALELAQAFNTTFSKVRQTRDILLIDQRGTGRSNKLDCEEISKPLSFNDEQLDITESTQTCLANIDADISQYASQTAVKDLEAVRLQLGYQKLHIYGISYGTRMAQLYMRDYPQAVATVTLDGVVPMQQNVLAISDAVARSFNLLVEECQQSPSCHAQFPHLLDDFMKLDQQLAQQPIIENISDPLTAQQTQLTLTRAKFNGAIRMALYMPSIRSLIPLAIHQAANGNYQPLLGLYAITLRGDGSMAMGMHAAVICSEDWPRLTQAERIQLNSTYMGQEMLTTFDISCPLLNVTPTDISTPVKSALPVLLLSGELDPATPPSWAELAKVDMSNATHLIAPHATHGVAQQSCANSLIAKFIDAGNMQDIDTSCLDKDVSRSFYLNANGVATIKNKD